MEENRRLAKEIRKKAGLPGACSLLTLTSDSKRPYWFRTCDISFDFRKEGAGMVKIERGEKLLLEGGSFLESRYSIQGISYQKKKTWLLDGINEEGLCGGLLMLSEGRGKENIEKKENEVMAMEAVTCLLAKCKDVQEVICMAENMEITNIPYETEWLMSTVHYHFLDKSGKEAVLEPTKEGQPGKLCIYTGREVLGVMTNSPVYPKQKENLSWFLSGSPELKTGRWQEEISLLLDGKEIRENKEADHICLTHGFPGSFASYDRFLRLAILKALNHSGNRWKDEEILPLGISLMNTVREPEDQGVLHYSCLKKESQDRIEVMGSEKSKTYYLVIYDLEEKKCYLQWFDEMQWTCYTLR